MESFEVYASGFNSEGIIYQLAYGWAHEKSGKPNGPIMRKVGGKGFTIPSDVMMKYNIKGKLETKIVAIKFREDYLKEHSIMRFDILVSPAVEYLSEIKYQANLTMLWISVMDDKEVQFDISQKMASYYAQIQGS